MQKTNLTCLVSDLKRTGEKKRLTTPPANVSRDTCSQLSRRMEARWPSAGHASAMLDLYLLHLGEDYKPQGEPKKSVIQDIRGTSVWPGHPMGKRSCSPREILRSGSSLWRMDISKPGKPVRTWPPSDNASCAFHLKDGEAFGVLSGKVTIRTSGAWTWKDRAGSRANLCHLSLPRSRNADPAYSPTARGLLSCRSSPEQMKSGSVTATGGMPCN